MSIMIRLSGVLEAGNFDIYFSHCH